MSTKTPAVSDIRPLAVEIADLLPGFTAFPVDPTRVFLRHEDGREIFLHLGTTRYGWVPEGRIRISGEYGTDNGQRVLPWDLCAIHYGQEDPAITVAAGRPAKQIASQIELRFLEEYTRIWQTCQAKLKERRQYCADTRTMAEAVAQAFGVSAEDIRYENGGTPGRVSRYINGRLVEFRVSASSAEIKGSLPPEVAAAVALVLAAADNR